MTICLVRGIKKAIQYFLSEKTLVHGPSEYLDRLLEHETTHYLDKLDGHDMTPFKEVGVEYEYDVYGGQAFPIHLILYYEITM